MLRLLLSIAAVLAACTAPSQTSVIPGPGAMVAGQSARPAVDSPAAAAGRRILSTAFVRVGPDSHLTVELQDGRVLVLRDVVMRPDDYCGVHVGSDSARGKYCGGYAEVAAARPGDAAVSGPPDAAASGPAEPARGA